MLGNLALAVLSNFHGPRFTRSRYCLHGPSLLQRCHHPTSPLCENVVEAVPTPAHPSHAELPSVLLTANMHACPSGGDATTLVQSLGGVVRANLSSPVPDGGGQPWLWLQPVLSYEQCFIIYIFFLTICVGGLVPRL